MINEAGLDLIKSFEGCKLKVYRDVAGLKTVGYGHRCDELPDGHEITQAEADELLRKDLEHFESGVQKLLEVKVEPNQFAALVAFAYNVGLGNLKASLLLRCLNKHNAPGAAEQFRRWTKAGGIEVAGLKRRREAERALFLL